MAGKLPDTGELYQALQKALGSKDGKALEYIKGCAVKLGHGQLLYDVVAEGKLPLTEQEIVDAYRTSAKDRGICGPQEKYVPSTPLIYRAFLWDARDDDVFGSEISDGLKEYATKALLTEAARATSPAEMEDAKDKAFMKVWETVAISGEASKFGCSVDTKEYWIGLAKRVHAEIEKKLHEIQGLRK